MANIKGLDRLNRKFAKLPKQAEDAAREAIAKGANDIVGMMRRLVPVDSGALRRSIEWTWGDAPEGSFVLGSTRAGAELKATIYAGNDQAYYARWVEFGTVNSKASPFFFPAYRARRKSVKSRIKRALSKAAKQ